MIRTQTSTIPKRELKHCATIFFTFSSTHFHLHLLLGTSLGIKGWWEVVRQAPPLKALPLPYMEDEQDDLSDLT